MHYIIHVQECFSCGFTVYIIPTTSFIASHNVPYLALKPQFYYLCCYNMYFTSVCTVLCRSRCSTAQIKGLVHSQMSTCTQLNCCSVLSWLQDDKRSVVSSSQSSSIFDNSIYKHPNNVCQTSSDTCPAHVGIEPIHLLPTHIALYIHSALQV